MEKITSLINEINKTIIENNTRKEELNKVRAEKKSVENDIEKLNVTVDELMNAIKILNSISESTINEAYGYISEKVNAVLRVAFTDKFREVKLVEHQFKGQYPQLSVVVKTSDGKENDINSDLGHGIQQIISLIIVICMIIITGKRRLVVIDEVMSGIDVEKRKILDDLFESFGEIGFQFIISEHGFCSKNSKVYVMHSKNGVASIEKEYIAEEGIYLQGERKYNSKTVNAETLDDTTEQFVTN